MVKRAHRVYRCRTDSARDFEVRQEIIISPSNRIDDRQLPMSFSVLQCEVGADFAGNAERTGTSIADDRKLTVIGPLPHFLNDLVSHVFISVRVPLRMPNRCATGAGKIVRDPERLPS